MSSNNTNTIPGLQVISTPSGPIYLVSLGGLNSLSPPPSENGGSSQAGADQAPAPSDQAPTCNDPNCAGCALLSLMGVTPPAPPAAQAASSPPPSEGVSFGPERPPASPPSERAPVEAAATPRREAPPSTPERESAQGGLPLPVDRPETTQSASVLPTTLPRTTGGWRRGFLLNRPTRPSANPTTFSPPAASADASLAAAVSNDTPAQANEIEEKDDPSPPAPPSADPVPPASDPTSDELPSGSPEVTPEMRDAMSDLAADLILRQAAREMLRETSPAGRLAIIQFMQNLDAASRAIFQRYIAMEMLNVYAGPEVPCNCPGCMGDRYNYYEFANQEFKDFIGDIEEYKQLYNRCSNIFFSHHQDFVGRFTEPMIKTAFGYIDKSMDDICKAMKFEERQFFETIYVPILKSLYERLRKEREQKAEELLKGFILKEKPASGDSECTICLGDDSGDIVKLSCGHMGHYECTKTWFIENVSCPICRAEVKMQLPDELPAGAVPKHCETEEKDAAGPSKNDGKCSDSPHTNAGSSDGAANKSSPSGSSADEVHPAAASSQDAKDDSPK